jgi:lysophospholipase L1-like esterase
MKSFCDDRGYAYLDYFDAMVDQNGMIKADLSDDGLHPNSAGYRIMAPLALAAIDKTVGTGAPPAQPRPRKHRLFSKE